MKNKLFIPILAFFSYIAAAQTNYALVLNGTNNYVTIGTPISSNSSYTKEAWVYVSTSAGSQNIISSANSPFWINAGTLSAGQAGSYTLVTDPTSFPLNVWVHVAVTFDAATTTMKLYRDGILISSNSAVSAYTSENTFIGSHQGSTSFLQGAVDEVRIWNTALTQAQLKKNIYGGPAADANGLVAYYKCNEGSGTMLTSSCTNTSGLNGMLQNSTGWEASPVQFAANAISFDGINDVVTIPDDNTLDITSAITLEAWCYATKNSGIQNVINKSSNTVNTGYIFPRTDDGWSHVIVYLFISGGFRTLSATYPSLNVWHHLAATYDGATMKLYIDGVLSASQAQTGTIATNSNPLTLGNQTGFSEYFGGYADEFRIWNVARTQSQIQAGMNQELEPTAQSGLVSYYKANQGIASGINTGLSTLIDMSGNNNGVLANFALSSSNSNFIPQFSNINVLLPVSLINFTAQKKDNTVLLNWSTASEQNSKEFVIQHASHNGEWDDIGAVVAAGTSNTVKNYQYVHSSPVNGINYYRLAQTDIDDRVSYSAIRTLKFTGNDRSIIVLNNPVTNGILQVKLSSTTRLSLYNSEGRRLWQKQLNAGTEAINVNGYSKGSYLLKAGDHTEKVIIY